MPSPFPFSPMIFNVRERKRTQKKYIYVQVNEKTWVAMDSVRLDITLAVYSYLEKEIYRVLKCHRKNSSYAPLSFSATCNKHRTSMFQNK